jgi:hypothetical protein
MNDATSDPIEVEGDANGVTSFRSARARRTLAMIDLCRSTPWWLLLGLALVAAELAVTWALIVLSTDRGTDRSQGRRGR